MSRRTERVASLVRSILAEAIQCRLSDPRIEALTSITRVEVSPDLSYARVFVSVMAPETRQKLTVQALTHATHPLRRYLGDRLTMRQVPELDFRLDDSIQQSFRTVQELDRLMAEIGRKPFDEEAEDVAEDASETLPIEEIARDDETDDARRTEEDG